MWVVGEKGIIMEKPMSNVLFAEGYNQACKHWRAFLPDEKELKEILLNADLEFNKLSCCDDDFNEYLTALAKAISKRLNS